MTDKQPKPKSSDWRNLPLGEQLHHYLYQLYKEGKLSYSDGIIHRHFDGRGGKWLPNGIEVGRHTQDGYKAHSFRYNGRKQQIQVHRIVFIIFNGPDSLVKGRCINHIDGNKKNNRIENLEQVTQKDNIKHSLETGLKNMENNNTSKLTWNDVGEIRSDESRKLSTKELSLIYGVTPESIRNVLQYKSWKENYNDKAK